MKAIKYILVVLALAACAPVVTKSAPKDVVKISIVKQAEKGGLIKR